MKTIILIDMSNDNATSGVNPYVECLIEGVKKHENIHVCWVCLISSSKIIFHRTESINGANRIDKAEGNTLKDCILSS